MGVGGHFWDLLKPYGRLESVDFLRGKRVAVDLSFWIVQHDSAIRRRAPRARSPHLRTTFFRTIALFSKMGAFPVFVVDGDPSPLKARVRMERFLKGVDASAIADPEGEREGEEVVAKKRNGLFQKYVRECVELLELLGMPVLKAHCEAEALCAQLNIEGHVDACITSDSDAFLFGANCVIKCFHSNSKEPFECYYLSDIEAGLGLGRKQMVAIGLLVGNDHDMDGVHGFGIDTAIRFVKLFSEDDILCRLFEVGTGVVPQLEENNKHAVDLLLPSSAEDVVRSRSPHCSQCGHPGSKRAHLNSPCEHCMGNGSQNCIEKTLGFRCECLACNKAHKVKELKKNESWKIKVYEMIALTKNFPNKDIVDIYLCNDHGNYKENKDPSIRWEKPNVDSLVDFLAYHQHWEPSYIRQRLLPMLSTIFLRDMALNPKQDLLLYDQYEFHSIQRVKIHHGRPYYLVKWKRASGCINNALHNISNEQAEAEQNESTEVGDSIDLLDEPDMPLILVDDGCWYLLTDENMELVQAAFPEIVEKFLQEKRLKESKSKQRKMGKNKVGAAESAASSQSSSAAQLSITQFYRTTKLLTQTKPSDNPSVDSLHREEGPPPKQSRKMETNLDKRIPKSVKRRLLFD